MIQPVFAQSLTKTKPLNAQSLRSQNQKVNIRDLSETEDGDINLVNNPANTALNAKMFKQLIKVHVVGDVKAPGIITTSITARVSDVLSQAMPNRKSMRIIQIRQYGEKTKYYDLYRYFYHGDLSSNPYLKDGDVIFVPSKYGAIRIEGPVSRPGLYELWGEKNIWQILVLSGGRTASASKTAPIKVIRFSEDNKKHLISVTNSKKALKKFQIKKGDIIVVPDIVNSKNKFDYRVETIPGEHLFYPTATPEVFVMGQVAQPGAYPYKSHLTIKDYMSYAAPATTAKLNRVTIVRNGKKLKAKYDSHVYAGDIIIVKEKVTFKGIITTVASSLSVVLTGLLLYTTIKNN